MSDGSQVELLKWGISIVVPALSGLIGVAVGAPYQARLCKHLGIQKSLCTHYMRIFKNGMMNLGRNYLREATGQAAGRGSFGAFLAAKKSTWKNAVEESILEGAKFCSPTVHGPSRSGKTRSFVGACNRNRFRSR